MSYLTESFAWCVLQVTLFSVVATGLYLVVRRLRPGTGSAMLSSSLAIVGLLTLVCDSPWPRWDASRWTTARSVEPRPTSGANIAEPQPAVVKHRFETWEGETLAEPATFPQAVPQELSPPTNGVGFLLVPAAWFVIGLGCLKAIVGFIHLRRVSRSSVPIEDARVLQISRELCEELAIRRSVAVRESSRVGVAAAAGWRRPMVILPPTWREWSDVELRAVLAHELAHIRLQHFPTWVLSQVTLAAHYYHPVVHWLARRLRLEHEIDADQLAAQLFGDRRHYASTLARLALQPLSVKTTGVGVGLFMSRPLLMRRIAMLRQTNEPIRSPRFGRAAVLLLLVAVAIGVAGLRAGQPARADEAAAAPAVEAAPAAPASASIPAKPALAAPVTPAAAPAFAAPVATQAPKAAKSDVPPAFATALLQVIRPHTATGGNDRQAASDSAWKAYSNTQAQLLSSHIVLQSALRDPKIATLPIVKAQKFPVTWLERNLAVGFYPNTDLVYVELPVVKMDDADQVRQIVDAVVQSYMNEIVNADRQRQLTSRDRLARSLLKLNDEVHKKMDEYYAIARELGAAEDGSQSQVQQQINLRRLDRAETELIRLEDEFSKAKANQTGEKAPSPAIEAYYQERIAELGKRVAELEEKLKAGSETSVDLVMRKAEIEQLQKIVAEMSRKLELMDVAADSHEEEPIRIVQQAVIRNIETAEKPAANAAE